MSYAKYLPYLCNANPLGRITRKFGAQGHTELTASNLRAQPDWSVCAVCPAKVEKVYTSEAVGNVVQYGYDSVKGRVTLAYYHLGKTLATAGQNVELGTKIASWAIQEACAEECICMSVCGSAEIWLIQRHILQVKKHFRQ